MTERQEVLKTALLFRPTNPARSLFKEDAISSYSGEGRAEHEFTDTIFKPTVDSCATGLVPTS